jgi:putative membrane protein
MLRTVLCSFLMLALTGLAAAADKEAKDKDTGQKGQKATITKVDAKNHTVTVRMKDKEGKEVEKTFTLTEDIRYLDSTGKVAAIDVFRSGDNVLVVEEEGRLKELHQAPYAYGTTAQKGGNADQMFLQSADEIDMGEVKLGKLAKEDAASAAIKKFGERMVDDHSKMNKGLREIAQKKGITLPEKLDQQHQHLCDQMSKLKGADFDRTYSKDMVSGHEKAVERFEAEAKNGQDPDVRAWAEKWLPTLREHLNLARDTVKDVKGER